MPRHFIIGSLLCLALVPAASFSHKGPYTEFRFDRIGVEDGLSNGAVNAIQQDQQGFMWFGTEDGLNRYDGRNFVIYRHEVDNENSLASGNFGAILQDRAGQMWLGTWGAGVDRFDPLSGVFTHFGAGAENTLGFRGKNTEFVFEDSHGDIWIGTERSGLNRYLAKEGRFEHYAHDADDPQSLGSDSVKAMEETGDGRLWIGTDAGLFLYQPETGKFLRVQVPGEPASGKDRIRSLDIDASNGLWVATRGDGLKRLDLSSGNWAEYRYSPGDENSLSENAIARVFVDSSGIVWVATYSSGLDRLDPQTGLLRNFDYSTEESGEGISFRRIDAIYEDRGGVLWFGTRGGGINKLPVRQTGFRNYSYEPGLEHGLPHTTVRSISGKAMPAGDVIWVGTDGGGLARFDQSSGHFEIYGPAPAQTGGLADGRIRATLVDRQDRLWVGTYAGGLHLLESESTASEFRRFVNRANEPDSLSSNQVNTLLEAFDGSVWVGTQSGLDRLRRLAKDSISFEHYRHDPANANSLIDDYITALLQDSDGRLWVGARGGLSRLDPATGRVDRYQHSATDDTTLSSNFITSLARDRQGRIWIGTDAGGLNLFDRSSEQFERITGLSGELGPRISSILLGADERLWLGSGRGLIRFDPDTRETRVFGLSEGLLTLGFLPGSAYATSNGELFFGGLRGMVSLFPGAIYENTKPPDVVITSVTRFDNGENLLAQENTAGHRQITLAYDEAFVHFEFAALDYTNPAQNRYAYRLEGVDQDWVETGNIASASYAALAPGEYVFKVKAANSDGFWNEQGVSLGLIVQPPFWQEWWFRIMLLMLVVLLLSGLHLFRTGAIRAQNLKLESLNSRLLDQIAKRNLIEGEREALIMELESRNAEMERFTYTVSHDLKSPLITIQGFLGLLRQDQIAQREDRMRSDIDKIESATSTMNQLLDELLQFSRAGKTMNQPTAVPLQEIVDEVLSLTRGEIENRGVEVRVARNLPVVCVDRVRFTEVLLNLVSNAVRFMGDQLYPKIEIGVRNEDNVPVFYVRDNGIGIDKNHHDKVFGLFERLDAKTPGTGIGLALVRRIIENHGGEIWVESGGPGTGSSFCFTVNTATAQEARGPSAAA